MLERKVRAVLPHRFAGCVQQFCLRLAKHPTCDASRFSQRNIWTPRDASCSDGACVDGALIFEKKPRLGGELARRAEAAEVVPRTGWKAPGAAQHMRSVVQRSSVQSESEKRFMEVIFCAKEITQIGRGLLHCNIAKSG